MTGSTDILDRRRRRFTALAICAAAAIFLIMITTLRLSYADTSRRLQGVFARLEFALARQGADVVHADFDAVAQRISMIAANQKERPADRAFLQRNLRALKKYGVVDIVIAGPDGKVTDSASGVLLPGSALQKYGLTTEEQGEPGRGLAMFGAGRTKHGRYPSLLMWTPYRTKPADSRKPARAGYAAAVLSLPRISARLTSSLGNREHTPFIVSRQGLFYAHPEREYLGLPLRSAMGEKSGARVTGLVSGIVSGSAGRGSYIAPSQHTERRSERWFVVYVPSHMFTAEITLGLAYERSVIPLLRRTMFNYFAATFAGVFLIAAFTFGGVRMYAARIEAEKEIRRLRDASAVIEILRNVNQDLTESQKSLEEKHEELETLGELHIAVMRRLYPLQEKFFQTIPEMTPDQIGLMREMRRYLAGMMRKAERRGKPPGNSGESST